MGIDGACWEFLDPLIAAGELPNLRRLRDEGATGRLRSIPCFVSPPSWATMMTGCLPEKTGVYTYGKWDASAHDFANVDRSDIAVPQVWDVASYCGRRVGVFNVPMTYPPRPVDGALVTGMMTPYELGDPPHGRPLSREARERLGSSEGPRSYSPVRRTATGDSLNAYLWSLYDTRDDGAKEYDAVTLDVVSRLDEGGVRRSHHEFDVDRFSPWIQIRETREGAGADVWCKFAIVRTDGGGYDTRISPTVAPIEAAYTYPDTLAAWLGSTFGCYVPSVFMGEELVPSLARDAAAAASRFYDMDDWDLFLYVFTQSDNMHHLSGFSRGAADVYAIIDGFIGDIMKRMPPDGVLIVASDHGFREYEYGVGINDRLVELGLAAFDAGGRVDYGRSLVFHNLWHLYFNHERLNADALRAHGIDVGPGEDAAAALARYLESSLARIESPDGALSVSLELARYRSAAAGIVPDMAVRGTSGEFVVDFLGFDNPHHTVLRQLSGSHRWWHQRDGVLMVWGDGVRRGFDLGTRDIQDVAPTMLRLLGVPASGELDGRAVVDAFDADVRESLRAYTVPDYAALPEAPVVEKPSRESLEKKLRSLGYVQ